MSIRTLIVEDYDETRQFLVGLCRALRCEVEEAADGDVGAAKFERAVREGRPFDLVILDLAMPVMDGSNAAKRMRAAEGSVRAWIEGYTGHSQDVISAETFTRAGINHVTVKPGSVEQWRVLIAQLVERKSDGRNTPRP